ncbi:MAG: hypothetical protein LC105_00445 [Chitinophagales bacterium]|nr:hypothetical protein [Chitinophagales bacterium]MCZ2392314.1 hypothetical protein [Chitinophagales bacterium]
MDINIFQKEGFTIEELFIHHYTPIHDSNKVNQNIALEISRSNLLLYCSPFIFNHHPDTESLLNDCFTIHHFPQNKSIKAFITQNIALPIQTKDLTSTCFKSYPLWIAKHDKKQKAIQKSNLNPDILDQFSQILNLDFLGHTPPETNLCFVQSQEVRDEFRTYFTPLHILDYTLAVLNFSFINSNLSSFIPFPRDDYSFWKIVQSGKDLRNIQLLQKLEIANFQVHADYPVENTIQNIDYQSEQILVNQKIFLTNISEDLWNFQFGDILPIQYWLKNKVNTTVSHHEIRQYIHLISAICQIKNWHNSHSSL